MKMLPSILFAIALAATFQVGRYAGKMTTDQVEMAMEEIIEAFQTTKEIHQINHPEKKVQAQEGRPSLDPNL